MCFVQYRMMRSYDDADILRRSDNSVLVHEVPASRAGAGLVPTRYRGCRSGNSARHTACWSATQARRHTRNGWSWLSARYLQYTSDIKL